MASSEPVILPSKTQVTFEHELLSSSHLLLEPELGTFFQVAKAVSHAVLAAAIAASLAHSAF